MLPMFRALGSIPLSSPAWYVVGVTLGEAVGGSGIGEGGVGSGVGVAVNELGVGVAVVVRGVTLPPQPAMITSIATIENGRAIWADVCMEGAPGALLGASSTCRCVCCGLELSWLLRMAGTAHD